MSKTTDPRSMILDQVPPPPGYTEMLNEVLAIRELTRQNLELQVAVIAQLKEISEIMRTQGRVR